MKEARSSRPAGLSAETVRDWLRQAGKGHKLVSMRPLGHGVHGTGYLIETTSRGRPMSYVIKAVSPVGFGHDYASDRAAMHLLALEGFNELQGHARALDVLSLCEDGRLRSVNPGVEYYLLMERVEGRPYFDDLAAMQGRGSLTDEDRRRIMRMVACLADLRARKPPQEMDARSLYLRKLRDTVGHGECLMGVLDTYPEGVLSSDEAAAIEKAAIDFRARLRPRHSRVCAVHGDFHPGNVWWRGVSDPFPPGVTDPSGLTTDMVLLDRSRGPWGEAADDVTAMTINYIFYSIMHHGRLEGAYMEALALFLNEYVHATGDHEILEALGLFYAFRGVVVANPIFYPDLKPERRRMIFEFIRRALELRRLSPEVIRDVVNSGARAAVS